MAEWSLRKQARIQSREEAGTNYESVEVGLILGRGRSHRSDDSFRNIDRILTEASSSNNNDLSYRAYGLLLCEVHVLRQEVKRILPKTPHRDFLEDVEDLIDIRTGIQKQLKVVDRIRWAYAKWLR